MKKSKYLKILQILSLVVGTLFILWFIVQTLVFNIREDCNYSVQTGNWFCNTESLSIKSNLRIRCFLTNGRLTVDRTTLSCDYPSEDAGDLCNAHYQCENYCTLSEREIKKHCVVVDSLFYGTSFKCDSSAQGVCSKYPCSGCGDACYRFENGEVSKNLLCPL